MTYPATPKVLVLFVDFSDEPPGGPAQRLEPQVLRRHAVRDQVRPARVRRLPGPPDRPDAGQLLRADHFGEGRHRHPEHAEHDRLAAQWQAVLVLLHGDGIHDYGVGPYPQNAQGLVVDAIKAADAQGVDFSQYAEDGVADVFVVHAGTGAEWSTDPDVIWSHSWAIDSESGTDLDGGFTVDGVKVVNYAMMPEVGGDLTGYMGEPFGPFPPTVGVYAHEFGHVVGLPDQYDYGYESQGTGMFSLMAGGDSNQSSPEWIFSGDSPALLDAWSKYRLGIITPKVVKTTTNVTLKPAETNPVAYKMIVPGSNGREYFLFENRQNIGFDEGLQFYYYPTLDSTEVATLPIHGMTVYHVDDNVFTLDYGRPNEAENWKEFRSQGWRKAPNGATHYAISVIQADDFWDLEHGWNYGDPGDTYPGYRNVTRLGNRTLPNTSSYYFWLGNLPRYGYSGVTASNIKETGTNVTATFSFQPFK